jgi:peptidyl-prolyl cis-trans isomerase D
MFEFIRTHSKWVMVTLFILIIPSFVMFGISGYNRAMDKGVAVAQVDGNSITQAEWDAAQNKESQRLHAQMPNADAKLLDSPEMRYATLERLVREQVLTAAAKSLRLVTPDSKLAHTLMEIPALAQLRKPDGSLDVEAYRQLLAAQGMSPAGFEAEVRKNLSSQQVLAGVNDSGFASPAVAALALSAFFQPREVQVALFQPQEFMGRVNPTEADLERYYQDPAHAQQFQRAEQADVEYVVLDLESVQNSLHLNEADVKAYFEQNKSRYGSKEERRASHILLTVPANATAAEREKIKAQATVLLEQVKKNPGSFAEVARKNSQDPGSAAKGGDLDFFGRGAMVKPFEDAAFALKKGEISDLVASDFGYHIILLTDVKASVVPAFETLRAGIEKELKQQQASKKFAEMAEGFTNTVYEESENFKSVAERYKLAVQTAKAVTREPAAGQSASPLSNPKLLNALFSQDSIGKKHNTEAIELNPHQLVSARIVAYQAARTLPLEEVKAQVRAAVWSEMAAAAAHKEGAAKLTEWKANPSSAHLSAAQVVARDNLQKLDAKVVDAALLAKANGLPQTPEWVGVDLGNRGYAVVKVNKVLPRSDVPAQRAEQEQKQFTQAFSGAESQAYYDYLQTELKTQIKVSKPAASASLTSVH